MKLATKPILDLFRWRNPLTDPELVDIELLVKDRKAFNEFLYTPAKRARNELSKRRRLHIPPPPFLPSILQEEPRAVIFRQLATSNYEMRRFVSISDSLDLKPLFWEYLSDKFTSNNEWKHALGKLFFYEGKGKKGGSKISNLTIVDFNTYNGKKISEVETIWGESLVHFHHELFRSQFRDMHACFFDASDWKKEKGAGAQDYYTPFLSLFIRDGILFENFLLDGNELEFTKTVVLPAFLNVWKETGHKPLIVSLEPTEIEGDKFWMCHPAEDKTYVESRHAIRSGVGATI